MKAMEAFASTVLKTDLAAAKKLNHVWRQLQPARAAEFKANIIARALRTKNELANLLLTAARLTPMVEQGITGIDGFLDELLDASNTRGQPELWSDSTGSSIEDHERRARRWAAWAEGKRLQNDTKDMDFEEQADEDVQTLIDEWRDEQDDSSSDSDGEDTHTEALLCNLRVNLRGEIAPTPLKRKQQDYEPPDVAADCLNAGGAWHAQQEDPTRSWDVLTIRGHWDRREQASFVALVDTGCAVTAITEEELRNIPTLKGTPPHIGKIDRPLSLRTASGHLLPAMGKTKVSMLLGGKESASHSMFLNNYHMPASWAWTQCDT